MEEKKKCKVKRLAQIGVIVEDVESAVRFYEEQLGVGPWKFDDLHLDASKGDKVDGEPSNLYLKGAFYSGFGPDIELIEPVSDCALKRWLESHGPGLHHLGFETEEGFKTVTQNLVESTGKKSWFRGDVSDFMKFAYFDFTKEMGTYVEFFGKPEEEFPNNI